jgi:hypothetical protein
MVRAGESAKTPTDAVQCVHISLLVVPVCDVAASIAAMTATFPLSLLILICIFTLVLSDAQSKRLYELVPETEDLVKSRRLGGIHLYALGDVPYLPRDWEALPAQLDALEPQADFVMHLGDLKKRSITCVEGDYRRFAQMMERSLIPVFNTIGDNCVIECSDSEEAYALWTKYLGNLDEKWTKSFEVARQSSRSELFAFELHGIFVIGIHVVQASFQENPMLYDVLDDSLAWLQVHKEAFEQAKAVVIFAHTYPSQPKFSPVRKELESIVKSLPDTPFIFLQGNFHHFQVDNPIPEADNFLRVVVDKGGIADPLAVTVDPESEIPFKLKRRALSTVS